MAREPYSAADFAHSPLVLFYELTRACDLVCNHCRACAQSARSPYELTNPDSRRLIEAIATFRRPPLLVLTGGDPLKRPDVFDLIEHARTCNLSVAITPSATPLVTREALAQFSALGVNRLAVSLDGADAATHDAVRGWSGSFDRTLEIMADARDFHLPLQVNTTISRDNVDQVDRMLDLLATQSIVLWSVFFMVPVGRARAQSCIDGPTYESVFEKLWQHVRGGGFPVKTTEAPHYRRYVLQQVQAQRRDLADAEPVQPPRMLGVQDGKGVMFISHTGRIYPSGFLPLDCGCVRRDDIVDVYQNHAWFGALREPDALGGKCGSCEFRRICGGSRARAFAATGNPLASDPDCVYQPAGWREDEPCLA